jgi:hypothetical protein
MAHLALRHLLDDDAAHQVFYAKSRAKEAQAQARAPQCPGVHQETTRPTQTMIHVERAALTTSAALLREIGR